MAWGAPERRFFDGGDAVGTHDFDGGDAVGTHDFDGGDAVGTHDFDGGDAVGTPRRRYARVSVVPGV